MIKCNIRRVQHQPRRFFCGLAAVNLVAPYGVAGGRHVHANLVRAPGNQMDIQQRAVLVACQYPPAGDGLAPVARTAIFAVLIAAGDGRVDFAGIFPKAAATRAT